MKMRTKREPLCLVPEFAEGNAGEVQRTQLRSLLAQAHQKICGSENADPLQSYQIEALAARRANNELGAELYFGRGRSFLICFPKKPDAKKPLGLGSNYNF
jgi:hypothetical protein